MPDEFLDHSDMNDQYTTAKLDTDSIYKKISKKYF